MPRGRGRRTGPRRISTAASSPGGISVSVSEAVKPGAWTLMRIVPAARRGASKAPSGPLCRVRPAKGTWSSGLHPSIRTTAPSTGTPSEPVTVPRSRPVRISTVTSASSPVWTDRAAPIPGGPAISKVTAPASWDSRVKLPSQVVMLWLSTFAPRRTWIIPPDKGNPSTSTWPERLGPRGGISRSRLALLVPGLILRDPSAVRPLAVVAWIFQSPASRFEI
jgi:hypothetical protein